MCCFDSKLNIVKYETIGDVLEEFYTERLALYEVRRQHQIATMKDTLEELGAKWLFVKAIVDKRLKIINEEDEIVLAGLKQLLLPPRSDRASPDSLGAYEYLLRMRVDRIKKKAVQEAEEEVIEVKRRLAELEATSAKKIWTLELDQFVEAWTITQKHMLAIMSASKEVAVKPKRKVVKKA
jgi:DNA topoisomerase-2